VLKLSLSVRRAVLALCLPLLLLTQQGSWLHALTHLAAPTTAQVPADDSHSGKPNSCGLCVVFTSLDAGATAPALSLPADPNVSSPAHPRSHTSVAHGSAARYFSRAPPALA
jgi:hypothetical protein